MFAESCNYIRTRGHSVEQMTERCFADLSSTLRQATWKTEDSEDTVSSCMVDSCIREESDYLNMQSSKACLPLRKFTLIKDGQTLSSPFQDPVSFWGGFTGGLLKLDEHDKRLQRWLAEQQPQVKKVCRCLA